MEVAEQQTELGRTLAVVTFAAPPTLQRFADELRALPYRFYGDPERATYAAFGFGRGSAARVWADPRVLARYARLLARGRPLRRPEGDVQQLGGDVLVDDGGRIEWIYRSAGPEDRPSVRAILSAAAAASG